MNSTQKRAFVGIALICALGAGVIWYAFGWLVNGIESSYEGEDY